LALSDTDTMSNLPWYPWHGSLQPLGLTLTEVLLWQNQRFPQCALAVWHWRLWVMWASVATKHAIPNLDV